MEYGVSRISVDFARYICRGNLTRRSPSWASTLRGPPGATSPVLMSSGYEKRWAEPVNAKWLEHWIITRQLTSGCPWKNERKIAEKRCHQFGAEFIRF